MDTDSWLVRHRYVKYPETTCSQHWLDFSSTRNYGREGWEYWIARSSVVLTIDQRYWIANPNLPSRTSCFTLDPNLCWKLWWWQDQSGHLGRVSSSFIKSWTSLIFLTIFRSAGAISVALQMVTNGGDQEGLFRGAFTQSGSVSKLTSFYYLSL